MMRVLDNIIRDSLTEFTEYVFQTNWYGRERETISFYTLGFLQKYCEPSTIFRKSTQISIEAAVPQLREPGRKSQVCKDLVIWPEPGMTCWNDKRQPVNYPIVIIEWKTDRASISKYDVNWLKKYSCMPEVSDRFIGYAVSFDLDYKKFRLSCTRVHQGSVISEWLVLK